MPGAAVNSLTPERARAVAELLKGAVDLHCHSGPSVMQRVLDHLDAAMDCEQAGFAALVFKDHYYPGMAHARIIHHAYPDLKVRLFSGVALNNAVGGVNPYAVDHCVKLGGKIVWMPTFSAANHIRDLAEKRHGADTFPKTAQRMLDPTPLSVLDANGVLTDETKHCLDLIAEGDVILAGGHLHISEQSKLFEEAKRRGVKKMMVNHPTYIVGFTNEDMKSFASMGVYLEHSVGMFTDGARGKRWEVDEVVRLMRLVGPERTILGSDLGLTGAPRPIEGFRQVVSKLLDLQVARGDIRKIISTNALALLGLAAAEERAGD
jgi:hypothetical protein